MDRKRKTEALRELAEEAARAGGSKRKRDRRLDAFAGLGPALRRLRLRHGSTQRQLARRAGITRPMISSYERGTTFPSLPTLDRLLVAMEVSPLTLILEIQEGGRD